MRKLFTLLILVFLWSTGMTQERVASNAVSAGSYAPQSVQTFNPLAPMQGVEMNAAVLNQNSGVSVSNKIEKKVQKVNLKSLPETTINPLAPLQGGENIGNAFVLTGPLPITSSGTTSGYANNYDEACPYTGSTAPDVVYAYTPPANVNVDIDLCGSSYDTKVFVYENAATPGFPFACNDDFYTSLTDPCGQWVSKITGVSLVGGNTYYIVIDGYSGLDFGAYQLEIRENVPTPPCVWGVDIIPPVGAIAETEACGTDANGGCNMAAGTETWEPVPSTGGTISGTTWANAATRDTDWFELVLTQTSNVTLTANATQLIIYGLITGTFTPGAPTCATVTSISPNNTAGPCNQTSLNVGVLAPGTYWFFVGMTVFEGFPCTNNYFITFSVVPESCPPPTALSVTNRTTTTADLSWTAGGTETGWVAEVGLPGFTPGTGEHIFKDSPVVNSVTATGLSSGTSYQMYVQADCNGTSSAWAGPVYFVTNIECPGGAISEAEVCGGTTNNGCNNAPPDQTSEPIALGQTVCGTSFYNGTSRDTDWYSFTLASATQVTLTGKADFDLQLLFVTSPCPASVIASGTALAGATATVTTTLAAGTYYAWVGPQFTGVFACGDDNTYYVSLTGTPPTIGCGNTNLGLLTPTTTSQAVAYAAGDTYYWSFNATAGVRYTFSNCGAGEDTYLRIYNSSFLLVASNDDFGIHCSESAASLDFTPITSGTYYVSLAHYSCLPLVNAGNLYYYYTAPVCNPVDQCNYTFRMTDSYGDGWNGNTMAVIQGGVTVQTLSLPDGYGPVDVLVGLCDGIGFDLFWNAGGSWADEVGIEILDPFGTSVYYKAPGTGSQNTLLFSGTTTCTPPAFKTLNLTSVFLEGLYAGGGTMNQAKNDLGNPQFPGYADEITVELHDGAAYGTIVHSATVLLSTTGSATVSDIPAALSGNYYITIRHRNSIETVSATAVSFAGSVINQSFGTPADVYGGNLQLMVDNSYAIFGGDVTQDGVVDTDDMTEVDNNSADYVPGYIPSDITGDGATDTEDMTIVDNNNANYVGRITPP